MRAQNKTKICEFLPSFGGDLRIVRGFVRFEISPVPFCRKSVLHPLGWEQSHSSLLYF